MIKRIGQCIIIIAILSISIIAISAPAEMDPNDNGTVTGLIYITNLPEDNVSVLEKPDNIYVISGRGKEGVVITVYLYDSETNMYKQIVITENEEIKPVQCEIGVSGLFIIEKVQLSKGKNELALRAAYGEDYEVVKKTINVQDLSFLHSGRLDLIRKIFGF